jgi:hypothetical protein
VVASCVMSNAHASHVRLSGLDLLLAGASPARSFVVFRRGACRLSPIPREVDARPVKEGDVDRASKVW